MPRKEESSEFRRLKKALHAFPVPSESKRKSSARGKWLEAVSTLNEILLDPSADLRSGVNAINEMLTVIENVLLEGFFKEYEQWLLGQKDRDDTPMSPSLVEKGEKVHKLILSRGKFILSILSKLKETSESEAEQALSSSLFQPPDWMEEDYALDDDS